MSDNDKFLKEYEERNLIVSKIRDYLLFNFKQLEKDKNKIANKKVVPVICNGYKFYTSEDFEKQYQEGWLTPSQDRYNKIIETLNKRNKDKLNESTRYAQLERIEGFLNFLNNINMMDLLYEIYSRDYNFDDLNDAMIDYINKNKDIESNNELNVDKLKESFKDNNHSFDIEEKHQNQNYKNL